MFTAFILILIHYVADFMFQTEDMAINKSKIFNKLLKHTLIYTFVVTVLFFLYLLFIDYQWNIKIIILFPLLVFLTHTLIDYITSKIVSKKFEKKEYYTGIPNFGAFSIIAFDQVLHYATLFLIYNLVI